MKTTEESIAAIKAALQSEKEPMRKLGILKLTWWDKLRWKLNVVRRYRRRAEQKSWNRMECDITQIDWQEYDCPHCSNDHDICVLDCGDTIIYEGDTVECFMCEQEFVATEERFNTYGVDCEILPNPKRGTE
ncbi:hypothetical protein LCGC14_1205540 [marine sediment metagenome]|uniref:Uncharacterized protein n=1 Tax=marine sediment metagenome TaxID=412755 RepID=A0A0F9LJZ0_9ZZZZ